MTTKTNITAEDGGTISYTDSNGNFVTESKSRSWGSNPYERLNEEPVPDATVSHTHRFSIEMAFVDNNEEAFRKQGEFIQQQLLACQDKDGNVTGDNYNRAIALSSQLEQLNVSRNADAQLRKLSAERKARGLSAPGGMLYEGDERGGTVTFFAEEPSAQDQFNALAARIDATRRRG